MGTVLNRKHKTNTNKRQDYRLEENVQFGIIMVTWPKKET